MRATNTKTVEEVTETLIDYRGKTPQKTDAGVKLITAKIIKNGFILDDENEYISEETYTRWMTRGFPRQGDILITTEAPLGEVARLQTAEKVALAQRIILLRGRPDVIDQPYYFYALKSPFVQGELRGRSSGTTVFGIKQSELRKVRIPWRPVSVQRQIGAILSAYDALITNNARRIKILEEMARRIYDEWFVRLRFPGHETARMVRTKLGLTPDSWDVKPIGDVVETVGGSTPASKNPEYWDGDVTWFTPSDLTKADAMFVGESERAISRSGLAHSSARVFPAYSVMMTSRATIGALALNSRPACTNQGFITCIPNEQLCAYHIYYWIRQNLAKIDSIASGATYKEINRAEFRSLLVSVPDRQTETRFRDTVDPMAKEIETLLRKNTNLRRTRDLLLPKLISGELDVSDLDIPTEAIV